MKLDRDPLLSALMQTDSVRSIGRLRSVVGLALEADLPDVRLGEICTVERRSGAPLRAEVVGFRDHAATLLPLGHVEGVGPGDLVRSSGAPLTVPCGPEVLGRVLDGLGEPLDGAPPPECARRSILAPAPHPLGRTRIDRVFSTGIRVIDGLATLGEGQRVGLFAGSGVGKSGLLGQIARQSDADVFVLCMVGERGREVREFIEGTLGTSRERGVVVCATSDAPALVRVKSAYVATAIAESFREAGRRVLLLMDSVTRFARAARDVGLTAGEMPARRGYPPSVFAALPGLVERAGTAQQGSITAVYTVLVEGDEGDDPLADELRGLLDGHIVLSRELANRGHFPAVDVGRSLSRAMERVVDEADRNAAAAVRAALAVYEQKRDLVSLGAYVAGSDPALDAALKRIPAIDRFVCQAPNQSVTLEETRAALHRLAV